MRKDFELALLIAYVFIVFSDTVLMRQPGTMRYELIPFWSWSIRSQRRQILMNIVMFIPVGLLLGKNGWKCILMALGISVSIELIQLVTHRGLFEFDDIIHNTLGAAIGFAIYILLRNVRKNDF